MELRVAAPGRPAVPVAVTMRTPGDDFDLAAGFLFTEGLIDAGDVTRVSYCEDPGIEQRYNVVTVRTRIPVEVPERSFAVTAACGICGKTSLDLVAARCRPVAPGPRVRPEVLRALPERLRAAQVVFGSTGGLHAAGLFTPEGELVTAREDVGRHNAVDKVVGAALLRGELPLHPRLLMVSGRIGFEIVQKAALAGVPVLCAVSAPSGLAVEAADRLGLTVVGFLRGERFNVYTHPERIAL